MTKRIATIEGDFGPIVLTQFIGPAHLVEGYEARNANRESLQVSDGLRLSQRDAKWLLFSLQFWLDDNNV